jgi:hypothetical protein
MTNREKLKIIKRNLNEGTNLDKVLQLKYNDNRLRIVAPIRIEDDILLCVQTRGFSKSGLSKSRKEDVRNSENTRRFTIDDIFTVRELK